MSRATRLSDVPTGGVARVVAMPGGRGAFTRLREMGVVPGTRVQLVRRAPLGDPLEIVLRGSLVSLRRSEAELIEVNLE